MKKLLFFLILLPFSVFAELRIDITQGNMDPIPVAILEFNTANDKAKEISLKIKKVISNNLQRSGLFSLLPKNRLRSCLLSLALSLLSTRAASEENKSN